MGSSFSSSSNGVAIWLDKPVYFGGDTVTGYVCINATEGFPANIVNVELTGRESVSWDELIDEQVHENDEWRTERRTMYRTASKDFFKLAVPLYTFPGQQMTAGQYQLPFSFMLPDGLPGSLTFRDNYSTKGTYTYQNLVAAVEYGIRAEVCRPGLTQRDLHGGTVMTVRQRLARAPSELVSEQTTSVSTCCCMGQGSVTVRVRVEKDSYAAGETAQMIMEVSNATELAFPNVEVQLVRVVSLVASSGSYEDEDVKFKQKCPGLASGTSYQGEQAQRLSIALPADLPPSTEGSLVRCRYVVRVELSAGTFTNHVKLQVPVTVYVPQPPHAPYATAPPDFWKPTVVGTPVQLALPAGPAAMAAPAQANPMYAGQ